MGVKFGNKVIDKIYIGDREISNVYLGDKDIFSLEEDDFITQLSYGPTSGAALSNSGRLFVWGANLDGVHGDGTTNPTSLPIEITGNGDLNNLSANDKIVKISLLDHFLALSEQGKIFSWGTGSLGRLGNNNTSNVNLPEEITGNGDLNNLATSDKIVEITAGGTTSGFLSESGRLFSCGSAGRVGDGTNTQRNLPVEITSSGSLVNLDNNDKIIKIKYGTLHSVCLSETGRLFSFGTNSSGQLGDGTTTAKTSPIEITSSGDLNNLSSDKIVYMFGGHLHSGCISNSGRVFMFGNNGNGRLGDGSTTNRTSPVEITSSGALNNLDSNDKIIQVLGSFSSACISEEGRVFTWGDGASGQLGDGTTTGKTSPIEITNSGDFNNLDTNDKIVQITRKGGGSYWGGLSLNKKVFSWGNNGSGQLGDGTTTNRTTPVEITNNLDLNI